MDLEFYITLILALLVSYLFGALPFADRISKRKGINIFQIGTKLAGASNVLRNVGVKSAGFVLLFDISKGVLAVAVAKIMGLEGFYLITACLFALLGHWNSIFTNFKGGDGLAIGAGLALGLFGVYALIAGMVAGLISLSAQKLPFSSLFSILGAYLVIVIAIYPKEGLTDLLIGFGLVCFLILVHALRGHKNRKNRITNI
ncbi:MAG: glycerol-3-phosphate acyltransferase [Dehalococcoidia bacterium]|jgi:glycerol-3-phosphate acyltransferase PlsY